MIRQGKTAVLILALLAGACVVTAPSAQAADPCPKHGDAHTTDNGLAATMTCETGPAIHTVEDAAASTSDSEPAFIRYVWVTVCLRFDGSNPDTQPMDCAASRNCADPIERLWDLWGQRADGTWEPLGSQCFGRPPTAAQTPVPVVTPGMVLQAIRAIGLPSLQAHTQPAGKTLVNFATIFYTSPQPFTRTIRLLGQPVHVEATATSFTWHHGDGTIATTTTPGAPYPDKQITYAYGTAHTTVRTSVDVTYTARFRVGGGDWQSIPETVTISGPASDLRISEATAVLSGDYQ
jgi:hypothetical protein